MPTTPPVSSFGSKAALFGILLLGLALRVWTIDYGIPHTVGVDEPEIMRRAIGMMKSGDFNPHFFDYGGLTLYFHMAVASVRFAVGAMGAEPGFSSLERVWVGDFLLWARLVTALIGTLLIYVVFRAGLRWGMTVAIVAAFVTAIQPNLARESHYALTDTPLTFLVALALLVSLIAATEERLRWFIAAGIAVGLATAVKYNGVLALLMPLAVAATAASVRRRAVAAITVVAAAIVAFLFAAPYSVLDLPHFLDAFARLAASYNQPRPALVIADQYLSHLRNSFGLGLPSTHMMGWPALLLILLGLGLMVGQLRATDRRHAALAVLIFTVVYVRMISHQSLVYARYYLPILPMLALAIGVAVAWLLQTAGRSTSPLVKRAVVAGLLLLAMLPIGNAARFNWDRRRTSTEEIAARWLEKNIPPADPILMEVGTIVLPPGFHWDYTHSLAGESVQSYRDRGLKYLVTSSEKFDPARPGGPNTEAYREILRATQVLHVVPRSDETPGPTLTVLKIP